MCGSKQLKSQTYRAEESEGDDEELGGEHVCVVVVKDCKKFGTAVENELEMIGKCKRGKGALIHAVVWS
jgi:hypothetical protein